MIPSVLTFSNTSLSVFQHNPPLSEKNSASFPMSRPTAGLVSSDLPYTEKFVAKLVANHYFLLRHDLTHYRLHRVSRHCSSYCLDCLSCLSLMVSNLPLLSNFDQRNYMFLFKQSLSLLGVQLFSLRRFQHRWVIFSTCLQILRCLILLECSKFLLSSFTQSVDTFVVFHSSCAHLVCFIWCFPFSSMCFSLHYDALACHCLCPRCIGLTSHSPKPLLDLISN